MSHNVGQKVEARHGGKTKHYGAVVAKANGDGTYELKYDDGDVEKAVKADLICAPAVAGAFAEGQKIEARYGGKDKWYGGAVTKDNGDGTYAVRYDDGDSEPTVKFVRALPGSEVFEDYAGKENASPASVGSEKTATKQSALHEESMAFSSSKPSGPRTAEEKALDKSLFFAVTAGDIETARKAVEGGADVNSKHGVRSAVCLWLVAILRVTAELRFP